MKLLSLFALMLIIACAGKRDNLAVIFQKVTEPVQITDNGKEHLFASYYGINSFSQSQKYASVLEWLERRCSGFGIKSPYTALRFYRQ